MGFIGIQCAIPVGKSINGNIIEKGKNVKEIYSELDFVYICKDGKRFITEEQAKKHQEKLNKGKESYEIFNR